MYKRILFVFFIPIYLFAQQEVPSDFVTPDAPTELTLQALSSTSVSISWSDNSDNEKSFKIYRDGKIIMITDADITSYIDSDLTPNTTYTYIVKASRDALNINPDNLQLSYDSLSLEAIGEYEHISIFNHSQDYPVLHTSSQTNDRHLLYDLPLVSGDNELNITITYEGGVSISKIVHVTHEVEAGQSGKVPIGLSVNKFSDVGELNATIMVRTTLDAQMYMFDVEGDGIIDAYTTDNNLTHLYTNEGRYKPRVTIQTTDGKLYTTGLYALALDVKATVDQKDPTGFEPIDIAKKFLQAVVNDDIKTVKEIVGQSRKLLYFLYNNPLTVEGVKSQYPLIKPDSWTQTYHDDNRATVKMIIQTDEDEYEAGFELNTISEQSNHGRMWYIRVFY